MDVPTNNYNTIKSCALLLFLSFYFQLIVAQPKIDSLNRLIGKATSDTQRINLYIEKEHEFQATNLDSCITLGNLIIGEAKRIQYKEGEVRARMNIAFAYAYKGNFIAAKQNLDLTKAMLASTNDALNLERLYDGYGILYDMQNKYDSSHLFYDKAIAVALSQPGKNILSDIYQNKAIAYQQQSNYPQSLLYYQKALTISEQANDKADEAYIYLNMANVFRALDDTARSQQAFLNALDIAKKMDLKIVAAYAYSNLAALYANANQLDKAYDYGIKAAALGKETGDLGIQASSLSRASLALAGQHRFDEAKLLNIQARHAADSSAEPLNIFQTYADMGTILKMQQQYTLAIPYYEKAFHSLTKTDLYTDEIATDYANLSACYEQTGDYKKSLAVYQVAAKIQDSIKRKSNIQKATEQTLNYEFDKKQALAKAEQDKKDAIAQKTRTQQYLVIAALAFVVLAVLIIAFIQFKHNRQKQKTNQLLEKQKQKVEKTLSELKQAQAQLIQSEKMASLGELTAGIAHEIQNPLNFVNNFSEVSQELLTEMGMELDNGNIEDAKEIAGDVIQNLARINHHGKRADAIVKGMLQHSRTSTALKEPTDINTLVEENLQLAYHGSRAKDASFNVTIKKDFDKDIGKIDIIPQDIGRVLLNVYNNAFYAVAEKQRGAQLPHSGQDYEPVVSIGTKKTATGICISIRDNGYGIPKKIVDKVFQPFFTTKPTGEGTGLGLSLGYDIVKAHGGTIGVQTEEGEFTELVICLPA